MNRFSTQYQSTNPFLARSYVYRYGFQGMEYDAENTEGAYDFGARIMETRLGRWLSLDFLSSDYPSLAPYHSCGNNPIFLMDPDGHQIIPVGDHRGNASAQQSAEMLKGYFTTSFGPQMADVLMSSMNNEKLGSFARNSDRAAFANSFSTQLSNISDEYTRTLAIGVYEAIMSNETISFIGYANNQGAQSGNSTPRGGELRMRCTGGADSNCENYFSDEQMVNGTPSLSQLRNGVDVLYDPQGPGGIKRNIDSGLVAASDGLMINQGSLLNPVMSTSVTATPAGVISNALNVVEQIAATNRVLNKAQPEIEKIRVQNDNPRQSAATRDQGFFRQIVQQATVNQTQPGAANNRMNRQTRQSMGDKYNPRRRNYSANDGE
jgi:RHS repeat-associated protein